MEIAIQKEEFLKKIYPFLTLIDKNTANKDLSTNNHNISDQNILIKSSKENGNINIIGSNSKKEIKIVTVMDAEIKKDGIIAVNPHLLSQIINEVSNNEQNITLTKKDKKLNIVNQKEQIQIICTKEFNISDFPKATKLLLSIRCDLLLEALNNGINFTELDNTLSILNNLYIWGKDNILYFICSSRTSISLFSINGIEFNSEDNVDFDILLGKDITNFLYMLCAKNPKLVLDIYKTSDNKLAFLIGDYYILSGSIHGKYPNILPLFDKDNLYKVSLCKKNIKEILKKIMILANRNPETVEFQFKNNKLFILFENKTNNYSRELDIELTYLRSNSVENESVDNIIRFNYLKLYNILSSLDDNEDFFDLCWLDSANPIQVSLSHKKIDNFTINKKHIIIPSR